MKARNVIDILQTNGWVSVRQVGSHAQFKKVGVDFVATVPVHTKDVSAGVLRALRKGTGIDALR